MLFREKKLSPLPKELLMTKKDVRVQNQAKFEQPTPIFVPICSILHFLRKQMINSGNL